MGNRANVCMRYKDEQVVLYAHRSGEHLPKIVSQALKRGKPRWRDFQYLTRIVFCEMVKDDVMGLTGFGITQKVWDGGRKIIDLDLDEQKVKLILKPFIGENKIEEFSFKEFIKSDKDNICF